MRFVDNLLNNKTIVLLNLAEHRLIGANSVFSAKYQAMFHTISQNNCLRYNGKYLNFQHYHFFFSFSYHGCLYYQKQRIFCFVKREQPCDVTRFTMAVSPEFITLNPNVNLGYIELPFRLVRLGTTN